jgi:histidinol-phosphate aminotransferase
VKASELVRSAVASMAGYVPGEQPADAGLVKLNTNENPYPPSALVVEAISREAAGAMERYPSPDARFLRETAAAQYGVNPSQVLAANGSDEVLSILLRACIEPGDVVAFAEPTYSLYRTLCSIAGARVHVTSCGPGVFPGPPFGEDARLTFVCNPNSPYGTEVSLDAIRSVCERTAGVVVADEAYVDFGGTSALSLLPDHPNLVVSRSFSKSFSLAGLRLGLAFASADLVSELVKVKDSYNVSRLAAAAGTSALKDYQHMESNVGRICTSRDRIAEELRQRGWHVPRSAANFLWGVPPSGGGRTTYQKLRERGVLVRFFDTDDLRDGLRISIGTDEQMERFLTALDQ